MREYRGKCNGVWIYGTPWFKRPNSDKVCIHHFPYNDDEDRYTIVDKDTLGQYTGLDDVNSVKIFDGDIFIDDEDYVYVVKYNNVEMKFELVDIDNPETIEFDEIELKVIGNIHDKVVE